jgi:dTDP-glucose pyrophosphorylase
MKDILNLVIPMAGVGFRFAEVGFIEPKPLINCLKLPMYAWAVKTFEGLVEGFYVEKYFIVLKQHVERWKIDQDIKSRYPKSKIIILDQPTHGQAQTVLMAKKQINTEERLIIFNADTYSVCPALNEDLHTEIDGLIGCFTSQDPRYSYARTNASGGVVETAEKIVISPYASNGLYYFRRGSDFVQYAEQMINNNQRVNKEFYVIPIYNAMIKAGKRIGLTHCKENYILGTPEELRQFESNYKG